MAKAFSFTQEAPDKRVISMRILITDTLSPGWKVGFRQAVNYSFIHHGSRCLCKRPLPLSFAAISALQTFPSALPRCIWRCGLERPRRHRNHGARQQVRLPFCV